MINRISPEGQDKTTPVLSARRSTAENTPSQHPHFYIYPFRTYRTGQRSETYLFSIQGTRGTFTNAFSNQQCLREFPEAKHFFGANRSYPYPPGTKIVLLKGRYKNQGAVTLRKAYRQQKSGYGVLCHKVIVADTTTFWVKQRDIYLLDPSRHLPTGFPLLLDATYL